jgi:hypothetical protein
VEQVLEGTGATDDVSLRYLRNMTRKRKRTSRASWKLTTLQPGIIQMEIESVHERAVKAPMSPPATKRVIIRPREVPEVGFERVAELEVEEASDWANLVGG